jgi:hypothetical protein
MTTAIAPPVAEILCAEPTAARADSRPAPHRQKVNKVELLKLDKDGLEVLPDIGRYAEAGDEELIPEDDGQRLKWFGLFLRKQTPGHMMMRLRATCGKMNADQWRVVADLSILRSDDPPANPDAVVHDRPGAADLAAAPGGRPNDVADRHGQRPRRLWLSRRGAGA